MPNKAVFLGVLAVLAASAAGFLSSAAEQAAAPKPDTRSPSFEQLIPRWELGDAWVVETVSRPIQVREGLGPETVCRPIQWQFAVARFEKALADDCYRIEVKCVAGGVEQPPTVMWIDKKSRALRQIQMPLPTPDGFQTITQSYEFSNGQPSPVLGPLSALPIDLPLFQGGQAKGMQTFTYQTHAGPLGSKAVGDLGFAYQVEQEVTPVEAEQVKGLVKESFTKGLGNEPVVEVRLKTGLREVRQLWQPGLPWPVYSRNGSTECRLVKVIPAGQQADAKQEPQP